MTSLLVPVGFLLMNIVILLIWWIVRRERQRISQIEEKVDTVGRIIMDIQQQQKRQMQQMGQFHGDHVMAQEVYGNDVSKGNISSSTQNIPETLTEATYDDSEDDEQDDEQDVSGNTQQNQSHIELIEPVAMNILDIDISQQDSKKDINNDEDSEYGSELDSLTDDENVQIHNQNDAHDKISVSDMESLAESLDEETHKQHTPDTKTIRLYNVHDISSQSTSFQGVFELGEQEKPQVDIQDSHLENTLQTQNESTEHHEIDEEIYKKFSKLTVKELRKLATEAGIPHVDKLKKKSLVIQLSIIPTQKDDQDTNETSSQDINAMD